MADIADIDTKKHGPILIPIPRFQNMILHLPPIWSTQRHKKG